MVDAETLRPILLGVKLDANIFAVLKIRPHDVPKLITGVGNDLTHAAAQHTKPVNSKAKLLSGDSLLGKHRGSLQGRTRLWTDNFATVSCADGI